MTGMPESRCFADFGLGRNENSSGVGRPRSARIDTDPNSKAASELDQFGSSYEYTVRKNGANAISDHVFNFGSKVPLGLAI